MLELNFYNHIHVHEENEFCHCFSLRPSQNVKLGMFTGYVVQLTAKKCTKKRDARAKLLFCLVKLLLI